MNNGLFNKFKKYNNLRLLISSSRGCLGIHLSSDNIWLRGDESESFLLLEIPGIIEPSNLVDELDIVEIGFNDVKDEFEDIDGNDDDEDEDKPGVEGPIGGGSFVTEGGV